MAGNAKRNVNLDRVRAALGRAFAGYLCDPADAPPPQDPAETAQTREPVSGEPGVVTVNGLEVPQALDPDVIDPTVLAFCADLDQSDTDNAIRLISHFGMNLRVLTQQKARDPLFVSWTGTHWDTGTGKPGAWRLAQRLGWRIKEEAKLIGPSKAQGKLIEAAASAEEKPEADRSESDRAAIKRAAQVRDLVAASAKKRREFGISARNKARIEATLTCVAPHVMTDPDAFNSDALKVAVRNATLSFSVEKREEVNPDAERDDSPPETPSHIVIRKGRVKAFNGHRREDLLTEIIPVVYDAKATCPDWIAFLEEFLPDDATRRMVQVAFGLGLLGVTVQKLFFHYGSGANGKSVCMEVICRVLGDTAVTLPSSSFFGPSGQAGGATPDMARLHGRRLLRVKELPRGEDLREDLVKELTGGEEMSVRDLYAGYFDFMPIFTGHMSGNDYPTITGTDNGIWRRMAVVLWPKTIPLERQRDFEDVVSGFEPEHSGILNWLIEGALIYLSEGLKIPDAVDAETAKYRAEMDPTHDFCAQCVRVKPDSEIPARELYQAYRNWALYENKTPMTNAKFGRIMGKKYERTPSSSSRIYRGITLIDVPDAPGDPGWHPDN